MKLPHITISKIDISTGTDRKVQVFVSGKRVMGDKEIAEAYSSMIVELRKQRAYLEEEQRDEKDHVIKMEIGHKIGSIDETLKKAGVTL